MRSRYCMYGNMVWGQRRYVCVLSRARSIWPIRPEFRPILTLYILVTKFQISGIFEKSGLYVKEVGPTSKKFFFPRHLYLCVLPPKFHFDSTISHVAIACKKLIIKIAFIRKPIFALTVNPLREVEKRTM